MRSGGVQGRHARRLTDRGGAAGGTVGGMHDKAERFFRRLAENEVEVGDQIASSEVMPELSSGELTDLHMLLITDYRSLIRGMGIDSGSGQQYALTEDGVAYSRSLNQLRVDDRSDW